MENLIGTKLGQYEIVSLLGEGGMAAVYKAFQENMDRHVALKVLPRKFSSSPEFVARFRQEAKVLARLQHPCILQVFDYGEAEGYIYIVMPLVEYGTLADKMRGIPFALRQAITIVSQVGDALDHAHTRGLVHRDIKPSNILLDERGNSLLSDFGIAKLYQGTSTSLTNSGMVVGTPTYMSPEQGQGKDVDGRSDLYALGVILFELATGRPPFTADNPMGVIFKHIQEPVPSPHSLNPNVPFELEQIILKALAKHPDERYPNAREMIRALQSVKINVRPTTGSVAAAVGGGARPVSSSQIPAAGQPPRTPPENAIHEPTSMGQLRPPSEARLAATPATPPASEPRLEAAAPAKPPTGPTAPAKPPTGPAKAQTGPLPAKPATGPTPKAPTPSGSTPAVNVTSSPSLPKATTGTLPAAKREPTGMRPAVTVADPTTEAAKMAALAVAEPAAGEAVNMPKNMFGEVPRWAYGVFGGTVLLAVLFVCYLVYLSIMSAQPTATPTTVPVTASRQAETSSTEDIESTAEATATDIPGPVNTLVAGPDIAFVYEGERFLRGYAEGDPIIVPLTNSQLAVINALWLQDPHLHIQPDSVLVVGVVTKQQANVTLREGSDLFTNAGFNEDAFAEFNLSGNTKWSFQTRGCMAVSFKEDKLLASCYAGECGYRLDIIETTYRTLTVGRQLQLAGPTAVPTFVAIPAREYNTYAQLLNRTVLGREDLQQCNLSFVLQPTTPPTLVASAVPPTNTPAPQPTQGGGGPTAPPQPSATAAVPPTNTSMPTNTAEPPTPEPPTVTVPPRPPTDTAGAPTVAPP